MSSYAPPWVQKCARIRYGEVWPLERSFDGSGESCHVGVKRKRLHTVLIDEVGRPASSREEWENLEAVRQYVAYHQVRFVLLDPCVFFIVFSCVSLRGLKIDCAIFLITSWFSSRFLIMLYPVPRHIKLKLVRLRLLIRSFISCSCGWQSRLSCYVLDEIEPGAAALVQVRKIRKELGARQLMSQLIHYHYYVALLTHSDPLITGIHHMK